MRVDDVPGGFFPRVRESRGVAARARAHELRDAFQTRALVLHQVLVRDFQRADASRDPGAALDDVREAVTMLEETERIGRRVIGGTHPIVLLMETSLKNARAALRARETPPSSA